jgi:O-antigen/teichoic acid export membrane protein
MYMIEFIVGIAAVVMPRATTLHTQGDMNALRDLFLKWSKIALSLTLAGGFFTIVFGPEFIARWVGASFERPSGTVLRILVVSNLIFLPVRGVAQPILMGIGHARRPTLWFVASGILNLMLSVMLVKPLGLAGVAIGTAIPNILFAVALLVMACSILELSIVTYIRYVVPRAAAGSITVLVTLIALRIAGLRGYPGMAVAALITGAVFAAIWTAFVYRHDRYVDLRASLLRLARSA